MNNTIIDSKKAPQIDRALMDWFKKNRRQLPFRETKSAYHIWISEIMAQQTQIKTLLPYYERFIEKFPTVEELARAPLDEVYRVWEGLGYYSRAKNLKRAAEIIADQGFPESYDELLKLPGIGPYTAGAVASIAFGERVPALDGNAIRVLSRLYGSELDYSIEKNKKQLFKELKNTMPEESATFNESLMELGALICLPKKPACLICPVRAHCSAHLNNKVDQLPVKKKQLKKRTVNNEALIVLRDGLPLYQKRGDEGLLANQYGFPLEMSSDKKGETAEKLALSYNTTEPEYLGHSRHVFTHIIWETDVFLAYENKRTTLCPDPSSVPTAFKKMLSLGIFSDD